MTNKNHLKFIAIFGLATQMLLPAAGSAEAQTVFTQRQIVNQLRLPRAMHNQPVHQVRRRAPQVHGGHVVKRRAPQPQGAPVVMRRVPQPQGGNHAITRVPQPQGGQVAHRRVPPPQGGVVFSRPPQPQGGDVAFRRVPQPQNGAPQEFRAPPPSGGGAVAKSRAPKPRKPKRVASVSSGNNSSTVRGLDVRPVEQASAKNTATYNESGRIDLEILFDYDSDRIDPASVRQLIELGEALNDPELGSGQFMIAGHTDAAGSNNYNNDLSFRRAQAVSRFLIEFAGVKPDRLLQEGFGEDYLKYPDAPESGQNRRVEIINLGESS
ncbi:MAG: OmpA family protein [Pseudomonadota bacterium]